MFIPVGLIGINLLLFGAGSHPWQQEGKQNAYKQSVRECIAEASRGANWTGDFIADDSIKSNIRALCK
ncbi:MAG: hypothetical protein CL862_02645 [Cyanobium sp. NAT70]|nr:hypothetical protein [Cyanobium sp. NAT70]